MKCTWTCPCRLDDAPPSDIVISMEIWSVGVVGGAEFKCRGFLRRKDFTVACWTLDALLASSKINLKATILPPFPTLPTIASFIFAK